MAARRRIDPAASAQALCRWTQEQDASGDGATNALEGPAGAERIVGGAATASPADRTARRRVAVTAVRYTLGGLVTYAPGRLIGMRVPPFGITQAVADTVHRRGTPPDVVETDAAAWLTLATGRLTWQDALADGTLHASGERCDLSTYLPLVRLPG